MSETIVPMASAAESDEVSESGRTDEVVGGELSIIS